jgi:GT2 family glycosyltransferase
MHSVAISICTRDRPDELAEALASIPRSSHPVHHVVVSNDGTDPRTPLVCEAAAIDVDYTVGPRRGLAANRNHSIELISEGLVLFLDDDCLLGADFLECAIACMASHEGNDVVGRVVVSGAEANRGVIVSASAQTFLGFQSRRYKPGERMTSIVINATLFPRGLFERHQFDEHLRYGYEEVDLACRAANDGYSIVSCDAAVNDHRPSPRSRADYASVVEASRLFVTFRRYALVERRYGHAAAFAILAPLHAIAAGLKTGGLQGARSGARSILLAGSYLFTRLSRLS